MKKIFLVFCFLFVTNSFSQESIFFFKIDTLYITYDDSLLNKNILREYEKALDYKTNANIGIKTSYNLLDFSEEKRKKEVADHIIKHPGIGMHGAAPIHFGLHFEHGTVRNKTNLNAVKETPTYKIFKKHHLEKDKVTHEDSLAFDKFVFYNIFRRYKSANTSLMVSEKELKNKQEIHFNVSKNS